MNYLKMEIIHQAAAELATAPHGGKQPIVALAAERLGLSEKRTYALIKEHRSLVSAAPERKRRFDANTTSITDKELELVAGVLSEGRRANGKAMWSIERAIDVLHADGKLATKLSPSRVSTLMRERHMHPDQLAAPTASTSMRTEHPNELWEIDASVCVLYRTPRGEVALMERAEFYKNKLQNMVKVMNDLVVRYVGTDHCSGAVAARFYLGGETTENALAFLTWLICQRTGEDGRGLPFYGSPFNLYTDQGSPFKSGLFVNFCKAMEVALNHHAPRNARATGQVENAQNLVERGMEGTLRFIDPETITMAMLDSLADQWMHWFNGTRRHERHKMTRYVAWSLITKEQLRVAPSIELLRELPTSEPKRCRVSNDMQVSFVVKSYGQHDYDVRHVHGAAPAEWVLVSVNPFKAPAVNVGVTDIATGEIVWQTVAPVERTRFGFDVEAPRYGEGFKSMPNTVVDERRNAIARQAYATEDGPATLEEAAKARRRKQAPYLGQFDPLADMKAAQVPAYLPRTGTAMGTQVREVAPVVLTAIEACKRLKAELGDEGYGPHVYAWVAAKFPDGVPEDQLTVICAQFTQQPVDQVQATGTDSAAPAGLRIVGGSA